MTQWIDVKYSNIVGQQLKLFKIKSQTPFTATFRCYVCGDSQKNPFKTRGTFKAKNQTVFMSCYNCGTAKHISTVLREIDSNLYNEYKLETLANKPRTTDLTKVHPEAPRPVFAYSNVLKGLRKISELPYDHPARSYLDKRSIPVSSHYKLYYAPRFKKFANSLIPDKFKLEEEDEPRLILPFIDPQNNVYGLQGRAFHDKSIRYLTVMLDNDKPKVFGWEAIKRSQLVNVVEGPIDSLFIDNCVALAGSDGSVKEVEPNTENVRFIYDNEPRNKQIMQKLHKVIDLGYNVMIWPDSVESKDINQLVIDTKMDRTTLKGFIDNNTYRGLHALARFSNWNKT